MSYIIATKLIYIFIYIQNVNIMIFNGINTKNKYFIHKNI
jgi:hypothetical protein